MVPPGGQACDSRSTHLGVWLIASGLTPFVNIGFLNMRLILAVLAIVAGVMILLGR